MLTMRVGEGGKLAFQHKINTDLNHPSPHYCRHRQYHPYRHRCHSLEAIIAGVSLSSAFKSVRHFPDAFEKMRCTVAATTIITPQINVAY